MNLNTDKTYGSYAAEYLELADDGGDTNETMIIYEMDTLIGLQDIREEHADALPVFIRVRHSDIRQIQLEHSYVVTPPGRRDSTNGTKPKRIYVRPRLSHDAAGRLFRHIRSTARRRGQYAHGFRLHGLLFRQRRLHPEQASRPLYPFPDHPAPTTTILTTNTRISHFLTPHYPWKNPHK